MDYQRDSNNIPMNSQINNNMNNNMDNMNDTYIKNLHLNNNDNVMTNNNHNHNNQNQNQHFEKKSFVMNPNNNFADALKEINETKFNGTDLYEHKNTNVNDNESLINIITNEITNRLGNKQISTDMQEFKSNNIKSKGKEKIIEKITKNINATTKESKSIIEKIISYADVRDFVIIFVIFFLLSQDMIKDFFSEFVTYLDPDDEGKIGIKGVTAYGILLGVLFLVVRKFF